MAWKVYQVVLRLRSPMHIGQMKLGNIQRTYPYVTGRVLWGALTARLARDKTPPGKPATSPDLYERVGKQVRQQLASTYLFPTTRQDGEVDTWPWEEDFGPRFLGTYASTALAYPLQSAAEGTLHEVECIVPYTMDEGQPVYVTGYVFAQENAPDWEPTLDRVQLGGERGYGWGRIELVKSQEWEIARPLFGWYVVEPHRWPPVLRAVKEARLVAHALAVEFNDGERHQAVRGIEGAIEPVVGRETSSDGRFGARVSRARICYAPGSHVQSDSTFRIGPYGIWEAASL